VAGATLVLGLRAPVALVPGAHGAAVSGYGLRSPERVLSRPRLSAEVLDAGTVACSAAEKHPYGRRLPACVGPS